MDQLLYTISECCRMAAIGRTKFYELIATGEIPVRKVGKKTLVAATDLHDWVRRLPPSGLKIPDRNEAVQAKTCSSRSETEAHAAVASSFNVKAERRWQR
jgi:excisionase family DNA binding protein